MFRNTFINRLQYSTDGDIIEEEEEEGEEEEEEGEEVVGHPRFFTVL